MDSYIPKWRNEFRDFAGAAPFHFEYWTALYQLGGSMPHISRSSTIVLALLALGASMASAQHPQTRKGFWIGFGLGYGSYGISCSTCSGLGRESSFTGELKLGGTVSPHLLLGAQSIAWTKSQGGATITAGNLSLAGYYYPKPAGGLFLSAGVGFSRVDASSGGSSSGKTGAGFTVGAGYDVRVAAKTSITPVANWVYGHPQSGFSQNFFQFGVGVTFH